MTIYDDLKTAVDQITAHYKEAASDGKLSFAEIFSLISKATASFIQLFEKFTDGASGADKKAAVLAALDAFFDEVISPLDIKGIPNFIEPVVDSSLKKLEGGKDFYLMKSTRSVRIFSRSG